jgi:hypothetical protein
MLPISAPWVVRIPGVSHQCQAPIIFFHLCIALSFPECQTDGIIQYVAFSNRLLPLSNMQLRFSYIFSWHVPHFFCYYWIIFHCMDVPGFVYLFTCWGTSWLLPVWGNCEWRCCEHSCIGYEISFQFIWVKLRSMISELCEKNIVSFIRNCRLSSRMVEPLVILSSNDRVSAASHLD